MANFIVLFVWAASMVFAYGYFMGLLYHEQKETLGIRMDDIFTGFTLAIGGPFTIVILAWVIGSDYGWKGVFNTKPYFTLTPENSGDS